MSRRANVPGILIISAIYWGALLYWKWDELFPDRPETLSWGEFFICGIHHLGDFHRYVRSI